MLIVTKSKGVKWFRDSEINIIIQNRLVLIIFDRGVEVVADLSYKIGDLFINYPSVLTNCLHIILYTKST